VRNRHWIKRLFGQVCPGFAWFVSDCPCCVNTAATRTGMGSQYFKNPALPRQKRKISENFMPEHSPTITITGDC